MKEALTLIFFTLQKYPKDGKTSKECISILLLPNSQLFIGKVQMIVLYLKYLGKLKDWWRYQTVSRSSCIRRSGG